MTSWEKTVCTSEKRSLERKGKLLQRVKWNNMVMRRRIFQVDSFIFAMAENEEVDDDDPCWFCGKPGPVCQ